jgi:hypothetical protein
VTGISEEFRRIINHYNIRTVFITKHTFHGSLMITRPDREGYSEYNTMYVVPPANVVGAIFPRVHCRKHLPRSINTNLGRV